MNQVQGAVEDVVGMDFNLLDIFNNLRRKPKNNKRNRKDHKDHKDQNNTYYGKNYNDYQDSRYDDENSLGLRGIIPDSKTVLLIAVVTYLLGTNNIPLPTLPPIPLLKTSLFSRKETEEEKTLRELEKDLKDPKNGNTLTQRIEYVKEKALKNSQNNSWKNKKSKFKKLFYQLIDFSTPAPYTIITIGGLWYIFLYKKNLTSPEALAQMARDTYDFSQKMFESVKKSTEISTKILKDYLDSALLRATDQANKNATKCEKIEVQKDNLIKENISLRENYYQQGARTEMNIQSLNTCKLQLKEEIITRTTADENLIVSNDVINKLQIGSENSKDSKAITDGNIGTVINTIRSESVKGKTNLNLKNNKTAIEQIVTSLEKNFPTSPPLSAEIIDPGKPSTDKSNLKNPKDGGKGMMGK